MTNLEIEAFLMVVKTGNMTKASEKLYVTQSALSRRLKSLEDEMGCTLIRRRKGIRNIELTNEGKAFIAVAEKWKDLWKDAQNISAMKLSPVLNISAVDSVSTKIIPQVYRMFLQMHSGISLSIRTFHSYEAYSYVESGTIDLAFITDDMYSETVETIPAFTEPMLFICGVNAGYPEEIHPSMLDASKEIRIPWCPEYDMWHDYWFSTSIRPRLFQDKFSLYQKFLFQEDSWAILPSSNAHWMADEIGVEIHPMKDGPENRIIYYLIKKNSRSALISDFLKCLDHQISAIDGAVSLLKGL